MAASSVSGPLKFGFEMGTGVRTYVTSVLPWALVGLILLLAPGLTGGVFIGVGFGAGRALVLAARKADPHVWDQRMGEAKRGFVLVIALAFCLIAVRLLTSEASLGPPRKLVTMSRVLSTKDFYAGSETSLETGRPLRGSW